MTTTSDPQRLRDEGTGIERDLIEAWSSRRAPAGTRARALALLGAGAGAAAITTSATASAASATSGAAGSTVAASTSTVLTAKLLGATVLALALGGAAAVALWPSTPPSAPAAAGESPVVASAPQHTSPVPPTTTTADLIAIPVTALPSVLTSASAPPPASSLLTAQLTELDAIREALASGRPDLALAALDRFSARHPTSPLAEEAAALRFDVHVGRGDRAAASAAARSFVAKYPHSPYVNRIRRASSEFP